MLKGLLNATGESAAVAAVAEREYLRPSSTPTSSAFTTSSRTERKGYIVMEYVNGTTLKTLRKQRGPLPPAEAIAYVHRILGGLRLLDMAPAWCIAT